MDTETLPNDRPLRIFLSSTARDLPEHRAAVVGIIDRLGQVPVRMETFGAMAGHSLAECKRLAAEADALVVVVAHRYGWVPTPEEGGDGEKSITWHEVEAALLAAKPVFRYLYNDDTSEPADRRADDDVRLKRFRQVLLEYPCDTFSTPDDLAKKVAVTLGDWSRRRFRDFSSALKMIDLTGYEASFSTLQPSPVFSLIRLLQSPTVSSAEVDQAIEGSHMRAAKITLSQQAQRCSERLSALESELSRSKSYESQVRALVAGLLAEKPPTPPEPPRPPSEQSPLSFDANPEARAMEYQRYLRRMEDHTRAIAHYEEFLAGYRKRQETIPEQQMRLERAQQQVSQLGFNLAQLTNDCESEIRRLELEVGAGRDQDISFLLTTMRDQGKQWLADSTTLSQGFILLLATELSASCLSKYLSDHVSAARWLDQLGHDVSALTTDVVLRDHQKLGRDCLMLFRLLESGLAQVKELTSRIRKILDAYPLDDLEHFCSESRNLLAIQVPAVAAYGSLISPDAIASASSAIARGKDEVGQALGAVTSLFDSSAALKAAVQHAEASALSVLEQMREMAGKYRPRLDEGTLVWNLVSHASRSQSFGADTREFCACLQTEAERRLGEPAEKLLARCEATDFGVRDAEKIRAEHVATASVAAFCKESEALGKHLERLRARAEAFVRASSEIADLPEAQAETYRRRLESLSWLTVLPLVNFVCALFAGALVRRYHVAMRSSHPAYQGLGAWSLPRFRLAVGLSFAGILVSSLVLYAFLQSYGEPIYKEAIVIFFGLSYAVSLGLWIFKIVSVSRLERLRQQEGREPGESKSGGD